MGRDFIAKRYQSKFESRYSYNQLRNVVFHRKLNRLFSSTGFSFKTTGKQKKNEMDLLLLD